MKVFLAAATFVFSMQASANAYFTNSAKDVAAVLENPVFARYQAFTIGHIRQGELGQAQAYFVRLVKPFNIVDKGVCLDFVNNGTWIVKGHPCACEEL